jgi:hypothetical protein
MAFSLFTATSEDPALSDVVPFPAHLTYFRACGTILLYFSGSSCTEIATIGPTHYTD